MSYSTHSMRMAADISHVRVAMLPGSERADEAQKTEEKGRDTACGEESESG